MNDLWTKALLGSAALVCASAANAYVIDFETIGYSNPAVAPLLANDDYITQGNFAVQAQDRAGAAGTFLSGAIMNGADAGTCLDSKCPGGNLTRFMGTIDDAVMRVTTLDGNALTLSSFSASFLAASGVTFPSTQVAYLAVEADRADGTYAQGLYVLNGPNASTGLTSFTTFNTLAGGYTLNGGTGTLTSGTITDYYFYAYYCSGASCTGTTNKAQFALDNINVSAVPEPSGWLLMAAGLGVVGLLARRRAA